MLPLARQGGHVQQLAGPALIVGSLDPCYSCTDRVTVTDVAAKRDHVLDKEQFENVWRDKSPLAGEGTMAAPLDEEAL